MMNRINHEFIADLEGFSLVGYVPDAENSKSGVTIATGFDLGCRDQRDINEFAGTPLYAKLLPYLGLSGKQAEGALALIPLEIDKEECERINLLAKREADGRIETDYYMATGIQLYDLPEQAQTVIASVAYQYGSLSRKCPSFWGHVIRQDWLAAVDELRNFGDRYPTRRNKEADYLEALTCGLL